MPNKYLLIDTAILPEVFEKVVKVKALLNSREATDVTEAVKAVGISRSSYYKYKDYVFTVTDGLKEHRVTLGLTLGHEAGTLSKILDFIAEHKCNILTINQDIPINNRANVSITFDIASMDIGMESLLNEIKCMHNVIKAELLAME
ncbi:MAG: ACT domain-containing protein [Bacillota bacterium]|nr:ACT domain-containing protein [Bacillota bacterium]